MNMVTSGSTNLKSKYFSYEIALVLVLLGFFSFTGIVTLQYGPLFPYLSKFWMCQALPSQGHAL